MYHVIHHEIGLSMLLQLAHLQTIYGSLQLQQICVSISQLTSSHHPHSWREGNPHFSSHFSSSSWIWKVHVSLQQQVYLYYHISHSRLKSIAWLTSAIHVQQKLVMYNRPGCVGEARGWGPPGKQASKQALVILGKLVLWVIDYIVRTPGKLDLE